MKASGFSANDCPTGAGRPDAIALYQALYDTLGRAYWETSDLHSKDTIQGTRDAIYDILTDLNIAKLQANTAAYLALIPRTQTSAREDQRRHQQHHKNTTTAATVISAITRVLNIVAMF